MSSIKNDPAQFKVHDAQALSAAQKTDLKQIGDAATKLARAIEVGDRKAIEADQKVLHDAFKKAHDDGFSKEDLRSLSSEVHENSASAAVAAHIAKGGKADDKQTAALLHNEYIRMCRNEGIKPDDKVFEKFSETMKEDLKAKGVSDADAQAALDEAKKLKGVPVLQLDPMRHQPRV